MYQAFKPGNLKITVGIAFDEHLDATLNYIQSFAEATGAKVRLVHAVEPWREDRWFFLYPGESAFATVAAAIEQRAIDEALAKLEPCAEQLRAQDIQTDIHICVGEPSEVLQADATAHNCSLIAVAASRAENRLYRLLPSGLSNALNLMTSSQVPVLVIPHGNQKFQNHERPRFLYADDLSSGNLRALHLSLEMACGIGNSAFFHLHICPTPRDEIEVSTNKMRGLLEEMRLPIAAQMDWGDLVGRTRTAFAESLRSRVGSADLLLQSSGCRYQELVEFGEENASLHEVVGEKDPDLVIFGRHETIRTQPLRLGRIPFWSMLHQGRPIIVTPNTP